MQQGAYMKEDYKVLVRVATNSELDNIADGYVDGIGSEINQTTSNSFDEFDANQNYAYCYALDLQADSVENAKEQLEERNYAMLMEDEIGDNIRRIYDLQKRYNPDEYGLNCAILTNDDYEKALEDQSIIEGEGYYEDDLEHSAVEEKLVIPEVLTDAYDNNSTLQLDANQLDYLIRSYDYDMEM